MSQASCTACKRWSNAADLSHLTRDATSLSGIGVGQEDFAPSTTVVI